MEGKRGEEYKFLDLFFLTGRKEAGGREKKRGGEKKMERGGGPIMVVQCILEMLTLPSPQTKTIKKCWSQENVIEGRKSVRAVNWICARECD